MTSAPRRAPSPAWFFAAVSALFFLIALFSLWREGEARERREARLRAAALPTLAVHAVAVDPERFDGRRVEAYGHYDRPRSITLVRRPYGKRLGARVLTPLLLREGEGAIAVLVDRGWIAEDEIDRFREIDGAAEKRLVFGVVAPRPFGEAGRETPEAPPLRWKRLDPRGLAAALPYPLLPLILVREAGGGEELPRPMSRVDRNRAREATKRAPEMLLGVALVAALVAFGLSRRRLPDDPARQ